MGITGLEHEKNTCQGKQRSIPRLKAEIGRYQQDWRSYLLRIEGTRNPKLAFQNSPIGFED